MKKFLLYYTRHREKWMVKLIIRKGAADDSNNNHPQVLRVKMRMDDILPLRKQWGVAYSLWQHMCPWFSSKQKPAGIGKVHHMHPWERASATLFGGLANQRQGAEEVAAERTPSRRESKADDAVKSKLHSTHQSISYIPFILRLIWWMKGVHNLCCLHVGILQWNWYTVEPVIVTFVHQNQVESWEEAVGISLNHLMTSGWYLVGCILESP